MDDIFLDVLRCPHPNRRSNSTCFLLSPHERKKRPKKTIFLAVVVPVCSLQRRMYLPVCGASCLAAIKCSWIFVTVSNPQKKRIESVTNHPSILIYSNLGDKNLICNTANFFAQYSMKFIILDRDPFHSPRILNSFQCVYAKSVLRKWTHMCVASFGELYGFQDACRDANQVTGKWLHLSAPYIIERGYAHVHMMSTRRGPQEAYKVREVAWIL